MGGRRNTSRTDVVTTGLPVASSIRQDGIVHAASGDADHAWLTLAAALGRAAARADRAAAAQQPERAPASELSPRAKRASRS